MKFNKTLVGALIYYALAPHHRQIGRNKLKPLQAFCILFILFILIIVLLQRT